MISILWLLLLQNGCQGTEKSTSTHFSNLKTLFLGFLVEHLFFFLVHLVRDGSNMSVEFFWGHLLGWCRGGARSSWSPGWGITRWLLLFSTILASASRSGPVLVLSPSGLEPRTGPVPESFRNQGPRTRTAKNRKKPVQTGHNRFCNKYIKMRAWRVKIYCSLTCYVNFKPLIVKIG